MVAYLLAQDRDGYDDCDRPIGIFIHRDEAEKHITLIEVQGAVIRSGYRNNGQVNIYVESGINKFSGLYVDQHHTHTYSIEELPMLRDGSSVTAILEANKNGTQG